MRNLDVWYTQIEIESLLPRAPRAGRTTEMRKRLDRRVAKASAATASRRTRSSRAKVDGDAPDRLATRR